MKKCHLCHILVYALSFTSFTLFAQPDSLYFKKEVKTDTIKWKTSNEMGLYLNQVSFSNWNAGGTNSISAILSGSSSANYKTDLVFWNSSVTARYGINKQEGENVRKTEDVLNLISNFGFQKNENSNWFYSARFSFNTQFANGFNYPDTDTPISKFLAPGYLFFGAGIEYGKNIERLSLYLSPLTSKTTFVLDTDLANSGAFGVNPAILDAEGNIIKPGDKVRGELGILITNQFNEKLFENIEMNSLMRVYTDYLNSFGNVDIDWEVTFDFTVNKYVKALLGSHLRYDNDIKTQIERDEMTNIETVISGAKLQWKQLLGVGVVVDLNGLSQQSSVN